MGGNLTNDRLLLKMLEDDKVRKNFEKIVDSTSNNEMAKFNWGFVTFEIPAGTFTNYKIAHGLNFIPTDIISTKTTGTLTFNYDKFDNKFLDLNATGPVSFRGLIGTYRENIE